MKLRACTLILTALCVCAAAWAQLKPGWNDIELKVFAEGCTAAILESTVRDYQATAAARGDTSPKPFPEKEFRDSVFPMCSCISRRLAEKWTLLELAEKGEERSKPFIMEALGGGECKPGGVLGEILEQNRKPKPD